MTVSKPLPKFVLLIFILLNCISLSAQTGQEVLLQAYNWESSQGGWWTNLNGQVNTISYAGIDVVWLPPASKSEDGAGFRPTEYYNINNSYGSQSQLQTLINSFHSKGIKVLADIVINHREGSGSCKNFVNPSWGDWSITNNDKQCAGTGAADTGEEYGAARDLDHTNTGVQEGIIWMMKGILKDQIGFDGWRYDFTKGYGGKYVGIYNQATNPYMSVGELWTSMNYNVFALQYDQNSHRKTIADWIAATGNTSCSFDFTTKGMLQEAIQYSRFSYLKDANGKPTGLIGIVPSKAVTFLDNHDTGGSQNHWPFHGDTQDQALKESRVMQGYAYILTHPGIPCIFWDHLVSWGTGADIRKLITIRKANGITSTSNLSIEKAVDSDCYAAIIEGTKGKIAVRIGTGTWTPSGSNWLLAASGTNYKIWEFKTTITTPALSVSPSGGTYIGGTTVTLTASGANPSFTIYYTTDGSEPTTASAKLTSGGTVKISSNTTLKAFVSDATLANSAVVTNTYITSKNTGFTVYFKKPAAWTQPFIYAWGPAPGFATITSAWPGNTMTDVGNSWYSYNFPTQEIVNIVFNNGKSGTDEAKTDDIKDVTKEIWYDYDKGIVIGVAKPQADKMVLFPNPVSDKLYLLQGPDINKAIISNITGQQIKTFLNLTSKSTYLDLEDLHPGIYFIRFEFADETTAIRKIIRN